MQFTVDSFRAWKHRSITLLGMSGVGKTYLSGLLRRHDWFHYSGDYRIGTRYLDEHILDLINAIIDPVVAVAVPAALNRLTEDPDQIRNLIWDQSGGLADEMANSFRARLVSADDAVNRLTDRLTGRARRQRRRASSPAATEAAT